LAANREGIELTDFLVVLDCSGDNQTTQHFRVQDALHLTPHCPLVIDDTAFAKKGDSSVGVTPMYNGAARQENTVG